MDRMDARGRPLKCQLMVHGSRHAMSFIPAFHAASIHTISMPLVALAQILGVPAAIFNDAVILLEAFWGKIVWIFRRMIGIMRRRS